MYATGKRITITGSEPLSLTEARLHLRLDATGSPPSHADDSLVTLMIQAAREYVETHISRAVVSQTVTAFYDDLYGNLKLPLNGAIEVTSITYLDSDGIEQTVAADDYLLDPNATPNLIYLHSDAEWPVVLNQLNAVEVTYTAGYEGSPIAYPARIKQAMLILIGDMYENREAQIIGVSVSPNATVDRLLYPLRELGV